MKSRLASKKDVTDTGSVMVQRLWLNRSRENSSLLLFSANVRYQVDVVLFGDVRMYIL
jgi:hypothetical protein